MAFIALAICVHDVKYKTQAGWQGSIKFVNLAWDLWIMSILLIDIAQVKRMNEDQLRNYSAAKIIA